MDADLPEQMIAEVLSRVPITEFLRLRCVCKTWKSFIDNAFLNHTRNLNFLGTSNYSLYRLRLIDLLSQDQHHPLTDFSLRFYDSRVLVESLLATCNSLLCFQGCYEGSRENLFVLETVTEELIKLPVMGRPQLCKCCPSLYVWGFGLNLETYEYKLVRIMPFSSQCYLCRYGEDNWGSMGVVVHAIGSDSWRTISQVPPRIYKEDWGQATVNGSLHWKGMWGVDGDDYTMGIISFSIADEVFDEMPYPESFDGDWRIDVLGVMGEKLCLMRCSSSSHGSVEIWVMEEYGVAASWERKITVRDSIMADSVIGSSPLRILPNGMFLAICGGEKIILYDPKSDIGRTLIIPYIKKWHEALICD